MYWIYKQLYQFTNNKLLWQRGNPSIDECYLYEPDLQPLIHAHSQPFQLLFKNNDSVKCLYVMVWLIPKVSIVTTTHTPLEILFGRCIIRPHACLLISDFFCTCYCRKIIISVSSIEWLTQLILNIQSLSFIFQTKENAVGICVPLGIPYSMHTWTAMSYLSRCVTLHLFFINKCIKDCVSCFSVCMLTVL